MTDPQPTPYQLWERAQLKLGLKLDPETAWLAAVEAAAAHAFELSERPAWGDIAYEVGESIRRELEGREG